jgi:hypothetical protein
MPVMRGHPARAYRRSYPVASEVSGLACFGLFRVAFSLPSFRSERGWGGVCSSWRKIASNRRCSPSSSCLLMGRENSTLWSGSVSPECRAPARRALTKTDPHTRQSVARNKPDQSYPSFPTRPSLLKSTPWRFAPSVTKRIVAVPSWVARWLRKHLPPY